MKWISRTPEQRVDAVFEQIVKSGAILRDAEVEMIPLHPDARLESYFATRARTRMERADFEVPLTDLTRVPGLVAARSASPVSDHMQKLTEQVCRLAPHYRHTLQSEDVSPYIYVMF
jgi:hypothetical protein